MPATCLIALNASHFLTDNQLQELAQCGFAPEQRIYLKDLDLRLSETLSDLKVFDDSYSILVDRLLEHIVKHHVTVLPIGSPRFMGKLFSVINEADCESADMVTSKLFFADSLRQKIEFLKPDGTVGTRSVFKHIAFRNVDGIPLAEYMHSQKLSG